MSYLRQCPGCKWQFPRSFNDRKCKFCGTAFNDRFCTACNELKPTAEFTLKKSECKSCTNNRGTKFREVHPGSNKLAVDANRQRRRDAADAKMAKWLADSDVKFKPMTELEWAKTCSYFDGCAMCGNEHIEVRQFFIPFKSGGRYSPWNMFPMCGKCATYTIKVPNPFIWLDDQLGTAHRYMGMSKKRIERMINYFEQKVSEAIE